MMLILKLWSQRNRKKIRLTVMEERFNNMQSMLEKLITGLSRTENQQQFNLMAETLVTSGVLKQRQ